MTKSKIIKVAVFDWKEDDEARDWIRKYKKKKFKVYSYDDESDTWLLIAVKGKKLTKRELFDNTMGHGTSLNRLQLVKINNI